METSPKTPRNTPSEQRRWWIIPLIVLFPIPFSPRWLGLIFGGVFVLLTVLIVRPDPDSQ